MRPICSDQYSVQLNTEYDRASCLLRSMRGLARCAGVSHRLVYDNNLLGPVRCMAA